MTPADEALFDAYLHGGLSTEDKQVLAGRLADDERTQREFAEFMRWSTLLARGAAQSLASGSGSADQADGAHGTTRRLRAAFAARRPRARRPAIVRWLPLAACALLALGFFLYARLVPAPLAGAILSAAGPGTQVIRADQRLDARIGMPLLPQDRLEVAAQPADTTAEVLYVDQSRMRVLPATALRLWEEDGAKRVRLERGTVSCDVAHQPAGKSMKLLTGQGEAEIVGTRLTLSVDQARTRLEVEEGTVALRRSDGLTVMVNSGYMAVAAADVALEPRPIPVRTLTGTTSQPAHSCFVVGQAVQLTFSASGLPPLGRDQLILRVVDEHQTVVGESAIPVTADAAGEWYQTIDAPHPRLGFYRAYARLASGATIPGRSSRPEGYVTYAVLPDPAQRPAIAWDAAFFGVIAMPGHIPALSPLLGSRWTSVGRWDIECPAEPLSAIPPLSDIWPELAAGTGWEAYPVFTGVAHAGSAVWADQVFVPGTDGARTSPGAGRLVPGSGERIFNDHCVAEAQARMRDFPTLGKRIYQITESDDGWGTHASAEDLVHLYRIAYQAIHRTDPQAMVIGAGFGMYPTSPLRPTYDQLYEAGLFEYLDALSIHLYIDTHGQVDADLAPERVSPTQRQAVRDVRAWMGRRLGRELPIYGTEQGFSSGPHPDPAKELRQAQYHIRSNLILLGEGLAFHWSFSGVDFDHENGWGFTYNLGDGFSTDQVGPKPVAAAYAAMTFLLEGRTRTRPLDGLGPTGMGYAYANHRDEVLALWDHGPGVHPLDLEVGAAVVTVHDWMGNARQVTTRRGVLHLELGNEPIYVTGAGR